MVTTAPDLTPAQREHATQNAAQRAQDNRERTVPANAYQRVLARLLGY